MSKETGGEGVGSLLRLGAELKNLRQQRGLSLSQLSRLAQIAKPTLQNWEHDRSVPRGPALDRFLRALEVPTSKAAQLIAAASPRHAHLRLDRSPLGVPVNLGFVLREMRKQRGLTQSEVARRIGVTQSALAKWESGGSRPSKETVHALAFALGASVEEAVALAATQETETPAVPSDLDEALAMPGAPLPLAQVVSLGREAEVWRRAAKDRRWELVLASVLAFRANRFGYLGQFAEIPLIARRVLRLVEGHSEHRGSLAAVPAISALGDVSRLRDHGHERVMHLAEALAARMPDSRARSWMILQQGVSAARLGRVDEAAQLIGRSWDLEEKFLASSTSATWLLANRRSDLCEAFLAAQEPEMAAELIDGKRCREFSPLTYVRVRHANGDAVSAADMSYARYVCYATRHPWGLSWYVRQRMDAAERRQAKLAGTVPVPVPNLPWIASTETSDGLWADVVKESPA